MTPVHLRQWQEEFVADVAKASPPARFVLLAPLGTGKSTVALELARRFAEAMPQFRALVVYDFRATGLNLLARAHRIAGLEERPIEKSWLRTVAASSKPYAWPQRIAAGIAARDLGEEWVRRALAQTAWDLVIVDDVHELERVSDWIEDLGASRIVVLTSTRHDLGRERPGWTTSDIWAAPFVNVAAVPTSYETVEFQRSPAEVALLRLVEQAVALAEGYDDWGAADLSRAGESSPFALQAVALRLAERLRPLRISYAHGRTADDYGVSEERRLSLSRIVAYFAQLEGIIEGVDALDVDARFQAFFQLVVDRLAPLQTPFVVFTSDQRTAEYLADRLRFMQRPAELIGPGWSPSTPPDPTAAYIVPDDALKGLDLGTVNIGVHYDAAGRRQFLREARLSADAERTIISLRDASSARSGLTV